MRNQEQMAPARTLARQMQLDVVALACNHSSQEAEAIESQVHGRTGPHSEAVSR